MSFNLMLAPLRVYRPQKRRAPQALRSRIPRQAVKFRAVRPLPSFKTRLLRWEWDPAQ